MPVGSRQGRNIDSLTACILSICWKETNSGMATTTYSVRRSPDGRCRQQITETTRDGSQRGNARTGDGGSGGGGQLWEFQYWHTYNDMSGMVVRLMRVLRWAWLGDRRFVKQKKEAPMKCTSKIVNLGQHGDRLLPVLACFTETKVFLDGPVCIIHFFCLFL